MNIGNYIKLDLKEKGKSIKWLCEKLNRYFYAEGSNDSIESKNLYAKLGNNTLTAVELVKIAIILDIQLDSLKRFTDITYLNDDEDDTNDDNDDDIKLNIEKLKRISDFLDETSNFYVLKDDTDEEVYMLLSFNFEKNFATMEKFDLKNNYKFIYGKINNLQEQLEYSSYLTEHIEDLDLIEKYHFLKDYFKKYFALYPERKREEENVFCIKHEE